MSEPDRAEEEAAAAAAEAARIGGSPSENETEDGGLDEAQRPLVEAGQGESEGFEQAEEQLIEHASHGDQHAARRAIQDAPDESDDSRAASGGEADAELTSEQQNEPR
jgi:hypothetical protein